MSAYDRHDRDADVPAGRVRRLSATAPGPRSAHPALPAVAPQEAGCTVDVLAPGVLVRLAGRLDVAAAADVRLALVDAVAAGADDLVLDLTHLAALDATGLGVLVGAHRRAQRAGRVLVLRDVTPAVARLLFLTRLDKVLRTTRTPVSA